MIVKFRVSRITGLEPPCNGAYLETVKETIYGVTLGGVRTEEKRNRDYWFVYLEWSDLEQFIIEHGSVLISYLGGKPFELEIMDGDSW